MDVTLTAEVGRTAGSRSSSRLRASGRVPGVVYGLGRDTVAVSVPWTELRRALTTEAGMNALITLDVEGTRDLTIVKDLQRDPVRRSVLHVDFLRVDPDAPVRVEVPIVLVGVAKEVENNRGIVDQQMMTLTVSAKPADIPNEVSTDISALELGSVVTAGDIELPAGVELDGDPDVPVVVGVATRFSASEEGEGEGAEGAEGESAAGEAGEEASAESDAE